MKDDSISRQTAIDTVDEMPIIKDNNGMEFVEKSLVKTRIGLLPPAEPERKTGEWYKPVGMMPPEYAGVYRCSECDEIAMRDYKTHKQMLTDFCPNCGADMRGDE